MTPAPIDDISISSGWEVGDELELDKAKVESKGLIELVTSLRHGSGPNVFRSFQPSCGFAPSLIRVLTGKPGVIGTAFDD